MVDLRVSLRVLEASLPRLKAVMSSEAKPFIEAVDADCAVGEIKLDNDFSLRWSPPLLDKSVVPFSQASWFEESSRTEWQVGLVMNVVTFCAL